MLAGHGVICWGESFKACYENTIDLIARAARGIEEEVRQGVRVPVGVGFAGRIARLKEPVLLDRVDSTTVANPILWEKGIRTMLGVPLSGYAKS